MNIKICNYCNKEFEYGANNRLIRYCSYLCQDKFRTKQKLEYKKREKEAKAKLKFKRFNINMPLLRHSDYVPLSCLNRLSNANKIHYKGLINKYGIDKKLVSLKLTRVDGQTHTYNKVVAIKPSGAKKLIKEYVKLYNETKHTQYKNGIIRLTEIFNLVNNYKVKKRGNIYIL